MKQVFGATTKRFRGTIDGMVAHQKRLVRGLANPRTIRVVAER